MKTPFTKTALTPEQLLAKLKAQGLHVDASQEDLALSYLRYVGAYRLKGYWHHAMNPTTKRFRTGYGISDIIETYEFDRKLRILTIEAIDSLEVSIRSVMANYLSQKYSPHWFLQLQIFKPVREWGAGQLLRKIEDEVKRSEKRFFVHHYFKRHDEPYLPPSWSISECVTFGLWSRTYGILKEPNDRKAISKKFGVDQVEVFLSWLHMLAVIRNIVAHNGQLYRVQLAIQPSNYKIRKIRFNDHKSFFAAATVINFLLKEAGLLQTWKDDLQNLFAQYPKVNISDIGFPQNWQHQPGW